MPGPGWGFQAAREPAGSAAGGRRPLPLLEEAQEGKELAQTLFPIRRRQSSAGQRMEPQGFRAETWPWPARRARRLGGQGCPSQAGQRARGSHGGTARPQPTLHTSLPASALTPPHPRGLARSGHARAWGRLSWRPRRVEDNLVVDAGSFPPWPRVRAGPRRLAFRDPEQGLPGAAGSGGAPGDPHPCPSPAPSAAASGETTRGTPRVAPGSPSPDPGPSFPRSDTRAEGRAGPGRGGGHTKELGGGSSAPRREPLSARWAPRAPAGHSPCRVRKSRPKSMPDGPAAGSGQRGGSEAPRDTRRARVRAVHGAPRNGLRGAEPGVGPAPPRPAPSW